MLRLLVASSTVTVPAQQQMRFSSTHQHKCATAAVVHLSRPCLQVVRNHPDYQRPYTGITALKTGEVAYDAASYLAESEQKSCAIAAGCFVTVREEGTRFL